MYRNVSKCTFDLCKKPLKTLSFSMISRVFRLAEKERFELYHRHCHIRGLKVYDNILTTV